MRDLKLRLRVYVFALITAGAVVLALALALSLTSRHHSQHEAVSLAKLVLLASLAALAYVNRAPWALLVAIVPVAAIRASLRRSMGYDEELVRIIGRIADAAESRHRYLAGTSRRVAATALTLARPRGLSEVDCRRVQLAGHLHDVAIALLPDFVELAGPESCDEHQRFFWSTHCTVGADLVARVLRLPQVAEAIEYHHERIDGSGYPHGRRGRDIPLDARIVAVSEAWVALRSERGYRPALSEAQALHVLHAGAGQQWDAAVVATLAESVRDVQVRPVSTRGIASTLLATSAG